MDNRYRKAIPLTLAKPADILPCTLDLLILRTLELGPLHGVAIADRDDRLFDAGARPSENFVTWSNRGEQALHRLQSLFATDPHFRMPWHGIDTCTSPRAGLGSKFGSLLQDQPEIFVHWPQRKTRTVIVQ